jgi:hypothetical protein
MIVDPDLTAQPLPAPIGTQPLIPPLEDEGGFFDAFSAGFQRENTMIAGAHLLTRETFPGDPLFDWDKQAQTSPFYAQSPESFYGATSLPEWQDRELRVAKEQDLLRRAEASGIGGMLGMMAGGVLDPTLLVPGGIYVKGAKLANIARTAAETAAVVGAVTAGQEVVLQQDQLTRTSQESALNVLAATAIGGLLGGAFAALAPAAKKKVVSDMAQGSEPAAISSARLPTITDDLGPEGESLSAAVNPDPFNGADPTASLPRVDGPVPAVPGVEAILRGLNPIGRGLTNADSETVRGLTASLDSGGLALKGDSVVGGDVESLRKLYYGPLYEALAYRSSLLEGNFKDRFMGVRGFNEETAFALRRGGASDNVNAAKYAEVLRQKIFTPMLKAAQEVNMPGFDEITDEFAAKYLNRVTRGELVARDHDKFVGMFKQHFSEQFTQHWTERLNKVEAINAKDTQLAEDLTLNPENYQLLLEDLQKKIAALPDEFTPEVRDLARKIRELRAAARAEAPQAEKDALRKAARDLEEHNKEVLAPFRKAEDKIKGRFAVLKKGVVAGQGRQAELTDRFQALLGDAEKTRARVVDQIQKILSKIDKVTPESWDEMLTSFEKKLATAEASWNKALKAQLKNGSNEAAEALAKREAEMLRIEALVEELHRLDPVEAEPYLKELAADALARMEDTNFRRRIEQDKITKWMREADPEVARTKADEALERVSDRKADLRRAMAEKQIKLGPNGLDVESAAEEHANWLAQIHLGSSSHLPMHTAVMERGPELRRMLEIDETRVWDNGAKLEDFLENDVEFLMRSYIRTMSSDIELMRKFGTVNPLGRGSPFLKKILEEFDAKRKIARETLEGKKLEKELNRLHKSQTTALRDLEAVVERIRHMRGVPKDATAFGYRLGKAARNMNAVTMMGRVVVTSLTDPSALIFKHGLTRTFRDGFVPFITEMKKIKPLLHEIKMAGTATDMLLHGRAAAMFDLLDEARAGTKAERGLQWATNELGFMSGLDLWNSSMKQVAGLIDIARISYSLEDVLKNGAAAKDSARFLHRFGINDRLAKNIWREIEASGDRVNGTMYPNTEKWGQDALARGDEAGYARAMEARRAFRAMLTRHIDDTINTPGSERPLMMDGSELGRLIWQFKSFTLSSTQKILWAGAQDLRAGDVAPIVAGSVFSLALGALSYYLWAWAAGEKAREEMRNASPEKWAFEAVERSGLLGVFGLARNVAEQFPGVIGQAATLGTGPSARSAFSNPVDALLGPTAGTLIPRVGRVLSGVGAAVDPNLEFLDSDRKALRGLTPYNNIFWLGWAFDEVEKALKK